MTKLSDLVPNKAIGLIKVIINNMFILFYL